MGIDGDRRIGKHGESVYQGAALDEADETNPDMLRNTPSNIRRLADEIEQCEGRQKYLAHTRSPSDGGDVRWYFCKVPLGVNELAASIPRTEIVGKGEYFRFGMRDSLAIEASFLQKEEELLSYWWKEYAECSEGPRGRPSSSTKIELAPDSEASELYAVEEERVGVPVKGGLYEVDLVKRHLFPVYWNGENRRVLRGHWFAQNGGLDWLPLREDIAEQLEFAYRRQVWHRRTFQPSGLFAARVNLHGFTPGLHALFTGEDDTWEAWLNVDPSGFSGVISLGANRVKLRRGYAISPSPKPTQDELRQQKEEEMDDYCSQVPVRHLVFMVHGIGQRLEKSNLVDDVTNFRHITSSLAEKHLTSYQRGAQRVLFIPCQWRKGLKLSSESAVEKITLDGVRGLRTMLSATVHDVLYYMSPIYCQDIIDSVSTQLNRLYLKFLKRNPGYDGKVSLYGHSLGSVLSYDILCHQENLSSPFPMDCMYTEDVRKDESPKNARRLSLESSMADGTEASPADKSIDQPVPVFLENSPAEVPCTHMDTSSSSPSATEEDSTERGCKMLIGTSSSPTDVHDFVCDSNHMLPPSNGVLDEANGIEDENEASSRETTGITNVVTNVTSQDMRDKDKQITILKEEVDFLKSRVMELESQVAVKPSQVSHNEHAPRPYQDNAGELPEGQDDPPMSYKPYVKYTKLEFKVDTFFAVGSPLGVFLALRNVRIGIGEGKDYWGEENIVEEMPACQQMFNIFHPFDPVAYRVEPLVCKEYVGKRPVIVPYHKGGKRLHIGLQDFAEDIAARSQAVMNHLSSVRAKVLSVCESRNKESLEDAAINDQEENARSYGAMMMERLTGSEEGRIDHVLQDKTFQHPYISAIGSHTNYWRDHDTALFILKHIYRDIPSEPRYGESSFGRISKDVRESSGWSDSKGTADEPLLLSSESIFSTNFSTQSKAR